MFRTSVWSLIALVFALLCGTAHAGQSYWSYRSYATNSIIVVQSNGVAGGEAEARAALLQSHYSMTCQSWTYAYNDPNAGNLSGPLTAHVNNYTRYSYPLRFTGCRDNYQTFSVPVYFTVDASITQYVCDSNFTAVVYTNGAGECLLPSTPAPAVSSVPGWPVLATIKSEFDCGCAGMVGDPINPANGNVVEEEIDYQGTGGNKLELRRTYNGSSSAYASGLLGLGWRHTFERKVFYTASYAQLVRSDGRAIVFSKSGGNYVAPAYHSGKLVALMSGSTQTGWRYTLENGDVENYTYSTGNIESLQRKRGGGLTFTWLNSVQLTTVSDGLGRALTFSYNSTNPARITRVTFPDATYVGYTYDTFGRLTTASYSDGTSRQYQYPDALLSNGAQNVAAGNLTAIIDEAGRVVASFTYDSQNRGVASSRAGGVDGVALSYTGGSTIITNSKGLMETHEFVALSGVPQATRVTITCPQGCPENGLSTEATYDANGNQTSLLGKDGVLTCSSYDSSRNLLTRTVEGLGAGADCAAAIASPPAGTRVTTIQWHTTLPAPVTIAKPLRITSYGYDAAGRATTITEQATTDAMGTAGLAAQASGAARTTFLTYDAQGFTTSIRSPRTDASSTTVFSYDSAENLVSVTDPTGLVTTFSNFDANGRAGLVVQPNGLQTTVTYDTRGRVAQVNAGGAVSTYSYTPSGLLTNAALASGVSLTLAYDVANRLTSVADSLGNRAEWVLDSEGNVLQESVFGNGSALALSRQMAFDQLSRLASMTKAQ